MDSSYLFDKVPDVEEDEVFEKKELPMKKAIDPTKPLVKRLFVGNLNNFSNGETLEDLVKDIMERFSKYGKILMTKEDPNQSTLNIGKNFAHVTMKFENLKNYQNLLKSYNNINFKGNKLNLQEAKTSYKEKIAEEIKQNELININKYNKEIIRKDYEHYKKLQNIKMSIKDRMQVIPGRNRVTKRNYVKSDKDEKTGKLIKYNKQRKLTFRIFLNGTLKVYQMNNKKKLWGIQKGRTLKDLAFFFDEKTYTWKNGLGHTIEHLNYNKLRRQDREEIERQKQELGDNEEEDEEMNTDVLTNIFNRINFDKQVEIGEDGIGNKDEYGSDYEMKHGLYDDDSEAEEERQQQILASINAEQEEADSSASSTTTTTSSSSEQSSTSDSDVTLESDQEEEEVEEVEEEENESSSEDEFVPKFGVPKTNTTETISNTETLRGLFQPKDTENEKDGGLKLIIDDNDIDHAKDQEINTIAEDAKQFKSAETSNNLAAVAISYSMKKDDGLFFPHFDSFFLQPQTSLNKVKTTQIETFEKWDETFWENRGKWTNEFKQRKRAELKKSRKKQSTSNVLL